MQFPDGNNEFYDFGGNEMAEDIRSSGNNDKKLRTAKLNNLGQILTEPDYGNLNTEYGDAEINVTSGCGVIYATEQSPLKSK